MAMKKRKLKGNSVTKRVRARTPAQKQAALVEARKNRAAKRAANRAYYRKNKAEITKRAAARRRRQAKGDMRVTRLRSKPGTVTKIKLGDR